MRQKTEKKGLNSHSPKVLDTSTICHIFRAYHNNILFNDGGCIGLENLNARLQIEVDIEKIIQT